MLAFSQRVQSTRATSRSGLKSPIPKSFNPTSAKANPTASKFYYCYDFVGLALANV